MTLFQDVKKLKNSDPSEEDLKRFYQKRDAYIKESKKLNQYINDFLELSPISYPDIYSMEHEEFKNKRKKATKQHFPNLDL